MKYTPEEIEKIKEENKIQQSFFDPSPIIFFLIGVAICGLFFYKHTN